MRKIQIDFAPKTVFVQLSRLGLISFFLICVCMSLGVMLGLRIYKIAAIQNENQVQLATKQLEISKRERQHARSSSIDQQHSLSPQQVTAVNQTIFYLNLPWTNLFDAVQEATVVDVAILKLEPDALTQSLKIAAESKSMDSMFLFLEKLARQAFFSEVVLQKHEIVETDSNKPVRFQLTLNWGRSN